MFRKEREQATRSEHLLSGKDSKRFLQQVVDVRFPGRGVSGRIRELFAAKQVRKSRLARVTLYEFLPRLDNERVAQLLATSPLPQVASGESFVPLFFEDAEATATAARPAGGDELLHLYPTCVALSLMPDLLPCILVRAQASYYVCHRGADLMLPGCVLPKCDPFEKGQAVAVRAEGNPIPFAVGFTLASTDTVAYLARGKLVNVLHSYLDLLWERTRLNPDPATFLEDQVRDCDAAEATEALHGGDDFEQGENDNEGGHLNPESRPKSPELAHEGDRGDGDGNGNAASKKRDEEASGGESAHKDDTPEASAGSPVESAAQAGAPDPPDPTTLLTLTFYQALYRLKDSDLPLLAATFFAKHLLPVRPVGSDISVKHTKFKKFGAFLEHMRDQGVCSLSEPSKGVLQLDSVNRQHEEIAAFRPWPRDRESATAAALADADSAGTSAAATTPSRVEIFFHHRAQTREACAILGISFDNRNKAQFSPQDLRAALFKYCSAAGLDRGANVELDAVLRGCLALNSKDSVTSKAEASKRFLASVPQYYELRPLGPGAKTVTKRGSPPPIHVDEVRFQNSYLTRVTGLETYGLEPESIAAAASTEFAAASTCKPLEGKQNVGKSAVVTQGRVATAFKGFLAAKGVPEQLIQIKTLEKKNRKKG